MGGKGKGKAGPAFKSAPKAPPPIPGGEFIEGSNVEVASGMYEGRCGVAVKVTGVGKETRWRVHIEDGPSTWIDEVKAPPASYQPSEALKAAMAKAAAPKAPVPKNPMKGPPKAPAQPSEGDTVEVLSEPFTGQEAVVLKTTGDGKERRFRVQMTGGKSTWVDKVRILKAASAAPAVEASPKAMTKASPTPVSKSKLGFDGNWSSSQSSGKMVIKGNQLTDSSGEKAELTFIGSSSVQMMLMGIACEGELKEDGLHWSFGDVWKRSEDRRKSVDLSIEALQAQLMMERRRADQMKAERDALIHEITALQERCELAENELSALKSGFAVGAKVTWVSSDADVPAGTVGTVLGMMEDRVCVEFANGKGCMFQPGELEKV